MESTLTFDLTPALTQEVWLQSQVEPAVLLLYSGMQNPYEDSWEVAAVQWSRALCSAYFMKVREQ